MNHILSEYLKRFIHQSIEFRDSSAWSPPADIYNSKENEWLLKIELAGVNVEEIGIRVAGPYLTLEGVRKDRSSSYHTAHSMEIAYNHFERVFKFSSDIESNIRTDYKDGMLYISLRVGGSS